MRYIIPGSDANKGTSWTWQHFFLWYKWNATSTVSNYQSLLAFRILHLNLADYNAGTITPNGKSVALTKIVLAENPILINKSQY
jgi:hypothetical protein